MKYMATVGGQTREVEVHAVPGAEGRYRLTFGGQVWGVDARLTAQGIYSLLIDGVSHVADVVDRDGACVVDVEGEAYEVRVEEQTRYLIRTKGGTAPTSETQTVAAPLPGKITHVAVKPGDRVEAGDTLIVIEAMKMENEFKAAHPGTVTEVRVAAGQTVNAGDVLIVLR